MTMTPEERTLKVLRSVYGNEYSANPRLGDAIAAAIREAVEEDALLLERLAEERATAAANHMALPHSPNGDLFVERHREARSALLFAAQAIRARGQHNTTPCAEAANQPQE